MDKKQSPVYKSASWNPVSHWYGKLERKYNIFCLRWARTRSIFFRFILRNRKDLGVISSSSSSSIKSRHCSKVIRRGGSSWIAISEFSVCILVSFFDLQQLISISSSRLF